MTNLRNIALPIWVKIAITITLAAIIPIVLFIFLSATGINTINEQNLRAYVTESGTRQEQAIQNKLTRTNEDFIKFLQDDSNLTVLAEFLQLLETEISEDQSEIRTGDIINLLDSEILLGNPDFNHLWLLTDAGEVIASTSQIGQILPFTNEFQAGSQAYLAGRSLSQTQLNNFVFITDDDGIRLQIVGKIEQNNRILGYLVADLNIVSIFYNNLAFQDTAIPAYSFLVLDTGLLLTRPEIADDERIALSSPGISRALNQLSGVDTYVIQENETRTVIGYYTPIQAGTNILAFVTEIGQDFPQQLASDYFENASFPLITGSIILIVILFLFLNTLISPPIRHLYDVVRGMTRGQFDVDLPQTTRNRRDEIGKLSTAFLDMRQQVQFLTDEMTKRIDERVRDLQATQEISRVATTQRNLKVLIQNVVDLIVDRFPTIYHAQIFLVDADGKYAVLQASTGSAGTSLLMRGHRLAVGSISVVGQASEQGTTVLVPDINLSQIHRTNEILSSTRAEAAIPLKIENNIIGVLDVQSQTANIFTNDLVNVLEAMADQISVAIQTAQLYQETIQRLEQLESSNRQATRSAWQRYMNTSLTKDIIQTAGKVTEYDFTSLRQKAMKSGKCEVAPTTSRQTVPVSIPIVLRSQTIGTMNWEIPKIDFNQSKILLAEELANRLALSLDNARLFQESQNTAERERIINTIVGKLSNERDINSILQTAVREVGLALRVPQVNIQLHQENQSTAMTSTSTNQQSNSKNIEKSNGVIDEHAK